MKIIIFNNVNWESLQKQTWRSLGNNQKNELLFDSWYLYLPVNSKKNLNLCSFKDILSMSWVRTTLPSVWCPLYMLLLHNWPPLITRSSGIETLCSIQRLWRTTVARIILQALSGWNTSVPLDESMQRKCIFQTPKHLSIVFRVLHGIGCMHFVSLCLGLEQE